MNLYKKPAYSKPWQRDPGQKNDRPVLFAKDEEHAEQLRQRMKRRKVEIMIKSENFSG